MSQNKKKYVFVLCPPYQGSTVIYRLLNTSPNVSTLDTKGNPSEGYGFLINLDSNLIPHRWDPDYNLNMQQLHNIYHSKWDLQKDVLCDKSPPIMCSAKKFYDWFSKYGDVYFIIMVRDPYNTNYGKIKVPLFTPQNKYFNINVNEYTTKLWDNLAKYQKMNIELFKNNSVFLTYEELCNNTEHIIERILKKMPFLDNLTPNKIVGEKINYKCNITHTEEKTKYFIENPEMINYFNYKIRE